MSKFELFKKLNLLIQISGIKDDPQYCGMLDISRPSPSDVYVSDFSEVMMADGMKGIDTYPNPMAVKFLMEVCEDVLQSKVPNRKDEFQLVSLAFDMAIKRVSLAIVEDRRYVFNDCEPLMHNYIDGGCEGHSTSSEIRNTLDNFNLNNAYVESAVSNTLNHPNNMDYVTRLNVDPKICLLAYMFNDEGLLDLVKYKIFGEPEPVVAPTISKAPKRIFSPLEAMVKLGMLEVEVNLADDNSVSTITPTLLGRSLTKDFETAIHHWSYDPSNRRNDFKLNRTWYAEHIKSVDGLVTLLMELLNFNNFIALENQKKRNLLLADIARAEYNKGNLVLDKDNPRKWSSKSRLHCLERSIKESSKSINSALDSVRIRIALTQFGLVVRNPLYDARDEVLEYNPPLILSGFGVVVAQYAMEVLSNDSSGPDLDDEDEEDDEE